MATQRRSFSGFGIAFSGGTILGLCIYRDVRKGKLVTELINSYKEIWMKPSMTLHYRDTVSRMIGNPSYPIEFSRITDDHMNFRISLGETVLVLNWMTMGDMFQHNLHHKMDEYMVRVHTTLALLKAPFNEVRHWMPKLK
ncbi:uncharacterized protein DS421_1g32470 [Arachis hypogaea]|nr:uncharacterized protein DS421_1g32470 [Arachis hypogaea]